MGKLESTIPTEKIDINKYLDLDSFQKFSDFNFKEEDFSEEDMEIAMEFWNYKNARRSSFKPYETLKKPSHYAAVIYLYNLNKFKIRFEDAPLNKLMENGKLFVEEKLKEEYFLEELFYLSACDIYSLEVINILEEE